MFGFITNPDVREKLEESEHRITKAYTELFSGYNLKGEEILNDVVHVKDYTGVVCMKDISFYTFCEHHFLPFYGTADVYYQPDKIITGLGKIVRLIRDVHARRLQIQEIMAKNIVDDMQKVLSPKGIFVEIKAKHLCVCSRGPGDDNTITVVTYGTGTLKDYKKIG